MASRQKIDNTILFKLSRQKKRRACSRSGSANSALTLLIIVLAGVAAILSYRAVESRFDSELRAYVRSHLSEMFPQAQVFVGRVRKEGMEKIIAQDVRLATISQGKPQSIFVADQVIVRGNLDIAHMVQQTVHVDEVRLSGVQIIAFPLPSGGWTVQCLKPQPKHNRPPPRIVFEKTSIRLRQDHTAQAKEIVVHNISATIQANQPLSSNAASSMGPRQLLVQATGASPGMLENLTTECLVDLQTGKYQLTGNFAGLQFSSKLRERLPRFFAESLAQFSGLECEADCSYFSLQSRAGQTPQFVCHGQLRSGRLQDPRLPYPLEQIRSEFHCENSLQQLRGMRARSGDASLRFETDIRGWGIGSNIDIVAQVENLDLDKRLYQSLPQAFQQQWDRLQLSGRVGGSLQLGFDGQRWQYAANIQCHQVSIRPWLFPYEFSQIQGNIQYRDGALISDKLVGRAGGQVVEGSLDLALSGNQWLGKLECRSLGPVAIDDDLLSALTPRSSLPEIPTTKDQSKDPSSGWTSLASTADGQRVMGGAETFVRSLNLAGGIELARAVFQRSAVDQTTWHRTLDLNVYDARLQYDRFKYPVYNIRGRILNSGYQWMLDGFEGRNDGARILGSGQWQQLPGGGPLPFKLHFVAHTVPVAEDLFRALPSTAQTVWTELQPSGSIDQVTTLIHRKEQDPEIQFRISLLEDSESNSLNGKALRLYPKRFQYYLENVGCKATYENGQVDIQSATASNGPSRVALRAHCRALAPGRWQADVNWLPQTRMMVDSPFVRALPQSIQESMQKLDFQGPVSLLGKSSVVVDDSAAKLATAWDCQLDVEDGRLGSGQHIGAMRGTIKVSGSSDGEKLSAAGDVDMDALQVLKMPVTNLRGPFRILDNKLYFGSAIQEALPSPDPARSANVTASALAGTLKLAGYGNLGTGKLYLDAELQNAHLSSLLKEVGISNQQPDATCFATLNFRGVPWNPQTYDGSGKVQLVDAKLYELPFMMRLLSVAAVNANDASAFQQAEISFRLDGDHVPMKVAADGEVLRLRGEGWTNLRREIDLQLYTYVGRRTPLGRFASWPDNRITQALAPSFMMIEVSGSLDNLQMQRQAFPQLEATLQQMFPDLDRPKPIRDAWQRLTGGG